MLRELVGGNRSKAASDGVSNPVQIEGLHRVRLLRSMLEQRLDEPVVLAFATSREAVHVAGADLIALVRDPSRVQDVDPNTIPGLLAELRRLEVALLVRAVAEAKVPAQGMVPFDEGDRLLTVREASRLLGLSPDYLYRHARQLPFAVRPSPGTLRFSAKGVQRFIAQQKVRPTPSRSQ
jgi:predicted DNA-binding transcriptional regulator AlpA